MIVAEFLSVRQRPSLSFFAAAVSHILRHLRLPLSLSPSDYGSELDLIVAREGLLCIFVRVEGEKRGEGGITHLFPSGEEVMGRSRS